MRGIVSNMEAMECGLASVCLRIRSGVPELVEDGVTGLLVDDRIDGFISAVQRLRNEHGLWERLSRAARAKIESEYSTDECAAGWGEFLWELQRNAGPRRSLSVPRSLDLPHSGELTRPLYRVGLFANRLKRLLFE